MIEPTSFDDDHIITDDELDLIRMGYPATLAKACCDEFDYALQLRTGTIVRFRSARRISNDWVHLDVADTDQPDFIDAVFRRGLDVRVSDIVWIADAPFGS